MDMGELQPSVAHTLRAAYIGLGCVTAAVILVGVAVMLRSESWRSAGAEDRFFLLWSALSASMGTILIALYARLIIALAVISSAPNSGGIGYVCSINDCHHDLLILAGLLTFVMPPLLLLLAMAAGVCAGTSGRRRWLGFGLCLPVILLASGIVFFFTRVSLSAEVPVYGRSSPLLAELRSSVGRGML